MRLVVVASGDLPLGLVKWITVPSALNRLTSSMAGMLLTPRRFRVLWRRLSSVLTFLWTVLRLRRMVPLPPVRPCERERASNESALWQPGTRRCFDHHSTQGATYAVTEASGKLGACSTDLAVHLRTTRPNTPRTDGNPRSARCSLGGRRCSASMTWRTTRARTHAYTEFHLHDVQWRWRNPQVMGRAKGEK